MPITGVTRGGSEWIPAFVISLDQKKCIGCGRCFKTCPRDVFDLMERSLMATSDDDPYGYDDDDFYGEDEGGEGDMSMVMNLKDPMDCIGCAACSRVCPKKCLKHAPQEMML